MNELKIFDEREVFGKQFRIYGTPEEPLFLAQDVADWIDHTNSAVMIKSIDDDEKGLNNVYTLGGVQEMWFLTEDGLYEVLMQSRKPIAKQFKKKVKEILRDIRRHGAYLTDQKIEELLISPDTIINLATQIKEEREKNKVLAEEIKVMKPKAQFADAVDASPTASAIGDLAKLVKQNGVDIGRNRMFEDFRNWGFLHKNGISKNMPTQKAMDMGLLEVKETVFMDSSGVQQTKFTPRVTGKGQIYFLNKYLIMKENGKAAEAWDANERRPI